MNLISIAIAGLLTSNVVLTKFLGICPFIGTSKNKKNALNMGLSVMIVVVLSSIITYFIYYKILVPTNTTYLKTIMFILVIASLVQTLELFLKRFFKKIYSSLGLYLPLITTNCCVLGIVLLNIESSYNLYEMLVYSVSASLGFVLVIYVFSSIRQRLDKCDVPACFKGTPIALILAAIMSIIFMRFH